MPRCSARHVGAVLVAAVLVAAGCAAPASYGPSVTARTGAAAPAGNQGGSWEVVLPGGGTGPLLAAGPEAARLDGTLAGPASSLVDRSYWPDTSTHLYRIRRLYLSESPRVIHYEGPPRYLPSPHGRPYYWGW